MTNSKLRKIYVFNLRGKPALLSIRQRVIYSRMSPLRRPVTAYKLAEMLGGLIDRQTITAHLQKLAVLGLVTQNPRGWVAIKPSEDLEQHFIRTKPSSDERWHGCFASWKLPLPLTNPFPGRRNCTELYAAYWIIYNLSFKKQKCGTNRLAALLGVTRLTARRLVGTLRGFHLLDGAKCLPHTWNLRYEEDVVPVKEDPLEDVLDVLIKRKTGRETIEELARQLETKRIMSRPKITEMARDALKSHDPEKYPGDGSALIIHRLEERLTTKADAEAADVARSKAAQRQHDLLRSRQIRQSMVDRVISEERVAAQAAFQTATDTQLEAADIALTGIRRGFTLVDILKVIRDPSTAFDFKAPPVNTPVVQAAETPVVKSVDKAPNSKRCVFVYDPDFEAAVALMGDNCGDEDEN